MNRTTFNDGWQFREKVNPFAELGGISSPYVDVTVPHDATISRDRDPNGNGAVAFFPAGVYQYRKTLGVPAALTGKRIILEFEGVYRDAMVYINGALAGQRPYGYSAFTVGADQFLRPGQENLIEVEARNGEDSRWYTGAGIYRNVWILTSEDVNIAPDGLRVATPDIDDAGAIAEVTLTVENSRSRPVTVNLEVIVTAPDGMQAAAGTTVVTIAAHSNAVSRQRLYVPAPQLWSAETPALHSVSARVLDDSQPLDVSEATFGIRKIQVDPVNGLRVNGATVKLRGACVHHDNGILGVATFPAAEERRVRLLKEAGFNAIRSAHNPLSVAMLEACDRLGMYVIDEAFDVWHSPKSPQDYSLRFNDWWQRDLASMIAKDFNHPSVISYSIGNEIPETGSPEGGITGRGLAEWVRELDGTRLVTNAINGLFAVLDDVKKLAVGSQDSDEIGINTLMAGIGDFMNTIGTSQLVTDKTAESFGVLDIAGMNYLDARYLVDKELFPNRVIIGTETFPTRIDHNWRLVHENSHVIGDFTWTGFDYLGEVGVGRPQYLKEGELPSMAGPYPWIAAWCGDLDLIGHRRPASYYRQIVFELRAEPYIAVRHPVDEAVSLYAGPWTWSDAIASWTWSGREGHPLVVEVYSNADEVELALNGRTLGTAPAGPNNRYRAEFTVPYQPGNLTATAIRGGERAETFILCTATGAPMVGAVVSGTDSILRFVEIALTDSVGNLFTGTDRPVTVTVSGEGVLAALGSGNPAPREKYSARTHTTFNGRALAVVRLTGTNGTRVKISTDECRAVEVDLSINGDRLRESHPHL